MGWGLQLLASSPTIVPALAQISFYCSSHPSCLPVLCRLWLASICRWGLSSNILSFVIIIIPILQLAISVIMKVHGLRGEDQGRYFDVKEN